MSSRQNDESTNKAPHVAEFASSMLDDALLSVPHPEYSGSRPENGPHDALDGPTPLDGGISDVPMSLEWNMGPQGMMNPQDMDSHGTNSNDMGPQNDTDMRFGVQFGDQAFDPHFENSLGFTHSGASVTDMHTPSSYSVNTPSTGGFTPNEHQGDPAGGAAGPHQSGGNTEADADTSKPAPKRRKGKPDPKDNPQLEIKKMTDVRSRACDECRRRKTACYYLNSETPKCFRCQMEDIDCTFSARTRAPATSSGSGTHRAPPISQRAAPRQLPAGLVGPVEDYSQLPGRSLLKKTLSLQHPRSSFAVGQHGLWDQRVLESIPLDKSNQARVSSKLSLRQVGADSWFMIRNEGGQADWVRDCDDIERVVYPYGRALVNAFFMYFQPEYPVLHEKIFVEKYMRTYRELMPALLGAVYLLGMRWWNHSTELSTEPRPDHIMPGLYDTVLANFFKSSGGSSLSLIQAGLLLLQCSLTDTRHLSICSVINAAALRLALNRNCLHWKLPRWEINLRIRLSWATYSQSAWISLFESVPPLIHDNAWFLAGLNADMFDSSTNEPTYNDALFIHLNKLSLIVHDMHNLLSQRLLLMYSNRTSAEQAVANNANVNVRHRPANNVSLSTASASQAANAAFMNDETTAEGDSPLMGFETSPEVFTETLVELIKPLQLRLHEWYHALPPKLVHLEGDEPTGNFSLRMCYIAAEVTLHRFIIRVISSKAAPSLLDPDMIKLLRTSARERLDVAYELLNSLRPQHLHQFWYFASSRQIALIGVFAALMYVTSEGPEEAEYFANLLRNYIGRIQLFSDNEVMSGALRTLRSSIAGVPGLEF